MEHLIPKLEELVKKELSQLTAQNSLSGTDLEKMIKATCALDQLESYKDRKMMERNGVSYASNSYGPMHHMEYDDMGNMSYARNRSRTTGQFTSYGSDPAMYRDMRYDMGHSSHSISDRMVASLEKMYDEANSPHEKQYIDEWIMKIRNGN